MIDLCSQAGYLSVSVAELSAHAGVSSKTFYEIFSDKEDCLLAAYREAAGRVLANVEPIAEEGAWDEAARSVLEQLLLALREQPASGRLLLVEALAGGAGVRSERERVLGVFEQRAQQFLDGAPGDGTMLDLPAMAMIGGVRSLVSRQLRTHSEDRLPGLVEDLLLWLRSYSVPRGGKRWSTGSHSLLPARRKRLAAAPETQEPARLPRGRHRLPAGAVARSQRTRIIRGTAEVMMRKGYAETTVSEIVAAAGISREVFYAHFANKQHAYLAAQQYGTQYILESCTAAYFSRADWCDRVWAALGALVELLAANPAFAHLRLVECYSAGPEAIESTEQLKRAATIFLQEGFNSLDGRELPHLSVHAIAGAIFEVFYTHISRGELEQLPRALPQLTYIAVAPFVGPAAAVQALERLRSASASERRERTAAASS